MMRTRRTLWGLTGLLLASLCVMFGLTARTSVPNDIQNHSVGPTVGHVSAMAAGDGYLQGLKKVAVEVDQATQKRASEAYGRLPLSFVANHDQTDSEVKFISRGSGYHLYLTSTEAVLTLRTPAKQKSRKSVLGNQHKDQGASEQPAAVLRMKLAGANPEAHVAGTEELPGKVNYFIGNDPAKWRTGIPTYARVHYSEVYPGVDLVYYGNPQQLEYDFVVAPGADPTAITLGIEGASKMRVDARGDLVLRVEDADVRWQKPIVYQEIDGVRREVAGNYVVKAPQQVGFEVGAYDTSLPLVIDPVLVYSSYLGGSGFDSGSAIAVDSSGNAYVTGTTTSANFPTTAGAFDGSPNGPRDAFVTKLNPAGTALVYSTYFGGSGGDGGRGIALDAFGNAFVTGSTSSTDFPTTVGAFDQVFNGPDDAFVTKLDATGTALVYSTYLGGSGCGFECLFAESGNGIAVDGAGSAYVTGATPVMDFPMTPGAFDTSGDPVGFPDVFVTKLNPAGLGAADLVYSTYLGGGVFSDDRGLGIAVDTSGSAYVTGFTDSSAFPTTPGAYDISLGGGRDAFVTKLNTVATGPASLVYSTFLGGNVNVSGNHDLSFQEQGLGIAVDASGSAYVTGLTYTTDFPTTPGAFDTTLTNVNPDAFVTKLNAAGSGLVYSTYLGDGGVELGSGIAVDSAGNAYVTGYTNGGFPTTPDAFQPGQGNGLDVFVSKLNTAGTALAYSTLLGGSGHDTGNGIAVDASGRIYVTGYTDSFDFDTTPPAFDTAQDGGQNAGDAFVTKFGPSDTTPPTISAAATTSPNAAGWYSGNVTVQFTCADTLSGTGIPAGACPANQTLSAEGAAIASTSQTVTDAAGNVSAASNVVTVKIDKTLPTITGSRSPAANAFGWNNVNVTVTFSCADSLSGATCSGPTTLMVEVANQSVMGNATDLAGNTAFFTVSGISIDKTAPGITVTAPVNGSYLLNQSVSAAYSCPDGLSPTSSCVGTVANGALFNTSSYGLKTFTVEATDRAGNAASTVVTYNVVFAVPINKDQCKDGGWQTLQRANGTLFKNQGDCVGYVNTGK